MRPLAAIAVAALVSTATAQTILYMPSNPDSPSFRAEISGFSGQACDYLDPRYTVPTLDQLAPYDLVFTWANYAYADRDATGDVLADYVDQGGQVLLGQWCLPSAGHYLGGRIMDPTGPYLPFTGDGCGSGSYAGDGTTWFFDGVSSYYAPCRDNVTLRDGFRSDGTYTDGYPFIGYGHGRVAYAAGLLADYGTGDGARIVANAWIPEPTTPALLALAGLAVIRRRQSAFHLPVALDLRARQDTTRPARRPAATHW